MENKMEGYKIYRYFHLNKEKNVFSNISQLQYDSIEEYLNFIKENNLATRSYDVKYLERRFKTEKQMYDIFVKKGGKPKTNHPYYFTLGKCHEWFYNKKHCFGSIEFALEEFDLSSVSFTYGDSIPTFMQEFADGKEYRASVYTFEEIVEVIDRKGMPNEWNTYEEHGPENYIEVQVWTDEFTSYLTKDKKKFNDVTIAELTTRIIVANQQIYNNAIFQKSIDFYIEKCYRHPMWTWFSNIISKTKSEQFANDIVHGIPHAHKCAFMAFVMASELDLNISDLKTLVYAALFHDVGRNFYCEGKSHGMIGADKIENYLQSEDAVHLKDLKEAIEKHDDRVVNSNNIFLTWLRDIDSLDYIRLGIGIYNTNYLKTNIAKSLVRLSIELNIHMYVDDDFISKIVRGTI